MSTETYPVDLSATTIATDNGRVSSECQNAEIRVERFNGSKEILLVTLDTDDGCTQAFLAANTAWRFYEQLGKTLERMTL